MSTLFTDAIELASNLAKVNFGNASVLNDGTGFTYIIGVRLSSANAGQMLLAKSDPNDFVQNYAGGDMRPATELIGTGYNGETPGADVDLINYRTRGCETGVWT